ncbi:Hsp20 family protein [Desulfitobacterium dehalogenans]|nr:Hsp20 family protein [Desulfitobacterium dehalogenans]
MPRVISFTRVKEEEIKAKYEDGVLQVTLPKMETSAPKKHQNRH